MKLLRPAIGLLLSVGLVGGGLVADVVPATAATEPPPLIVKNPHSQQVAVGDTATFTAAATFATFVMWGVKSPASSNFTWYRGTDTTTKNGKLKSRFTFGPFMASQNGWEVGAVFVNSTGVPRGFQNTGTKLAIMTLK